MILVWLIALPLLVGIVAWIAARRSDGLSRWIALAGLLIEFAIVLRLWADHPIRMLTPGHASWLVELKLAWIPQLGISFHLALDGLSLLLVALAVLLAIACILCSWTEIQERVGFFHFILLATVAGIIGIFLAMDLILFFVFWEAMLVPMYVMIAVWGHENKYYAALKFFLFTQAGGLLMLAAILGLYFVHGKATGTYTFDYEQLMAVSIPARTAMWLMLGFFAAFAVKLPAVPFHTWLPDAHTEAPTAGSVILAGLLLKTGGYGLIRFLWPLFPGAAAAFAPIAMTLGVIGIFYGALLAFAQTDLKRLVAYSSISHMGFVLLGVFAWNELAMQGAVVQMLCHGVGTGALFIIVGQLQERIHTRQLPRMRGFWEAAPRMGAVALLFALASLGLPGLGNFVGEFLVLFGTFAATPKMAIAAAIGIVFATVYSLWLMYRAFFGPRNDVVKFADLDIRESILLAAMIAVIAWIGLFPQRVLDTAGPTLRALELHAVRSIPTKADHPGPAEVSPAGRMGMVKLPGQDKAR
jgi:NADH-quinone oxidoreductase subunit M